MSTLVKGLNEDHPWRGPERHYDILKEATIAFIVVALLTVLLAALFSSPDVPPVTIRAWADAQPKGFTQIAITELDGTSNSAEYGPPYNNKDGSVQNLGPINLQRFAGIRIPINPAKDFVLRPLATLPGNPKLRAALQGYESAPRAQQLAWDKAYTKALAKASVVNHELRVPKGDYGPVGEMMSSLLAMARSGALDSQLLAHSSFYTTNYTKPILFIGDSWKAQHSKSYWGHLVSYYHLKGNQWGVMNETGSWPGQPWLWLYTMWYQIPPMSTSNNGDIEVIAIMTVLTLILVLTPFIPGLRDIPKWIPLHKVIWRNYYRDVASRPPAKEQPAQRT